MIKQMEDEDEQFINKTLQTLHKFREKLPEDISITYKKILKTRAHYQAKIGEWRLKITLWEEKDYLLSIKWGSKKLKFNSIDECIEFVTRDSVKEDMKFLKAVYQFESNETFLPYPFKNFKKTEYRHSDDGELESALCFSKVWVINRDGSFTLRNPRLLNDDIKEDIQGDIEKLRGKTWKNKEEMMNYFLPLVDRPETLEK